MSPELKAVATVEPRRDLNPRSWEEIMARAEMFSKSGLLPVALRGKAADIAIILQMGCELDIPPMQAINGITVIQGTPGVNPQLALALIRQRMPNALIQIEGDETQCKVTMMRDRSRTDEVYTAHWTMDKARRMGLDKKDNYLKQPGTMLKWRAVMECARMAFSDVLKGLVYSPEELGGEDNDQSAAPPAGESSKAKELAAMMKLGAAPRVVDVVVEPVVKPKAQKVEEPGLVNIAEAITELTGVVEREPAQASADLSILGEYVVPIGVHKGMQLSKIPHKVLSDYFTSVMGDYARKGLKPSGPNLELLMRIESYLAELEEKDRVNSEDDVHL